MKRILLLIVLSTGISTFSAHAQMTVSQAAKAQSDLTTPLQPADGKAYEFATEEEKNEVVPAKIEKIKAAILTGTYTEDRVKQMREMLWRYENATISNK